MPTLRILVLVLVIVGTAQGSSFLANETIRPGVYEPVAGLTPPVGPGSAVQGFADVWELDPVGERVLVTLAWSGEASLALRVVFPQLGLTLGCEHARGSVLSGERTLTVDAATPSGATWANVYVHPGLVTEETPYRIAIDAMPAEPILAHDDVSYTPFPNVGVCLI